MTRICPRDNKPTNDATCRCNCSYYKEYVGGETACEFKNLPLTEQEQEVANLLLVALSKYRNLPIKYKNDVEAFEKSIFSALTHLSGRILRESFGIYHG